ncbi:MAG TPA: hypothetical protein VEH48_00155 [Candidatus Nitrosopolaris sp.]|nr:hypothetical protein [Candidatus Nitrosopolaris sp.]
MTEEQIQSSKTVNRRSLPKWSLLILVIFLATSGFLAWRFWPRPLISPAEKQKISFLIFVPSSPYQVVRKTVAYDSQKKILTYQAKDSTGSSVFVVTEQTEPDLLSLGGQDFYNKFVGALGDYDDIDTAAGPVSLTRPSKLGSQTAVLVAQNTLVFVRPNHNLDENDWQGFFNTMQTYH